MMRKGPGSQEGCLEESLSNCGSENNRNYNSLVNRAWVLGAGGAFCIMWKHEQNQRLELALFVCVSVFRGQRPGVDTA